MNELAEALTGLQYANRFPTFAEYKKAAPIEQRAIIARWKQIVWAAAESGDWWPTEPEASIRAKSCLWAAGAYGQRPAKRDTYDEQTETGALVSGQRERVDNGSLVGE
jgi:hypothetical protein